MGPVLVPGGIAWSCVPATAATGRAAGARECAGPRPRAAATKPVRPGLGQQRGAAAHGHGRAAATSSGIRRCLRRRRPRGKPPPYGCGRLRAQRVQADGGGELRA